LINTNKGWEKIVDSDSLEGRLAKRKRLPDPEKISDWISSSSSCEVKYNNNYFTDSLVVDIDDDTKIALFTVWDDASCMLEIIDVETGNYIINKRRELSG